MQRHQLARDRDGIRWISVDLGRRRQCVPNREPPPTLSIIDPIHGSYDLLSV
jgi:hypothetical protein